MSATNESIKKFVDEAFSKFDKDHNGTLEYAEAVEMATNCFKHHSQGIPEAQLRKYFEDADHKKDGHITK